MSADDGGWPPPVRDARPPRYVPTLTEVVLPQGGEQVEVRLPTEPVWPQSPAPQVEPAPEPAFAEAPQLSPADEEERLLRVLQRVEVLLDRRLSAALAQAAESVSREFAARLKSEIEPLIREAVGEAMAEEMNPVNHPPALKGG